MKKIISWIKHNPNKVIAAGFLVGLAAFLKPIPYALTYVGSIGEVKATGPSEILIGLALVIIAIGVAARLAGTKNTSFEASRNKITFRTRK